MEKQLFLPDFMSSVALVIGLLLAALLWYYWRVLVPFAEFPSCRMEYRLLKWLLTGPKGVPVTKFFFQGFVEVSRKYKTEGLCVLWGTEPQLMVFGEESVKALINEPEATDKPRLYKNFDFALRKGIFVSNGEDWKNQKRIINPMLHGNVLKGMLPIFNRNAAALVEKLSGMEETTDAAIDLLKLCSFQIFCESSLDTKLCNLADEKKMLRLPRISNSICKFIMHRMVSPWLYWDFTLKLFPYGRQNLKAYKEGSQIFKEIIEDLKQSVLSRKEQVNESDNRKCLGEIFIEHHLRDPSFTLDDVTRQMDNFLTAGFDTTSNTMMWCLFLLGHHEDVQEQVYQEIMSVTEGDVHFDDLHNLKYLDSVLKETLRLYPVVPLYGRHLKKEIKIGKYKVPKNTTILFILYGLHRNPDVYSDPDKFDPERFIRRNPEIKPWTHIPFAEGIRPCVGKNFALMQAKTILSHVLRNFRVISLDRIEDVEVAWEIFLVPSKRLRLQFIPRNKS